MLSALFPSSCLDNEKLGSGQGWSYYCWQCFSLCIYNLATIEITNACPVTVDLRIQCCAEFDFWGNPITQVLEVIACIDCFRTQQFHALLDHYCPFCPILPFLSKLFCFYLLWSSLVILGGKGRKFPYPFSCETLWMVWNYIDSEKMLMFMVCMYTM